MEWILLVKLKRSRKGAYPELQFNAAWAIKQKGLEAIFKLYPCEGDLKNLRYSLKYVSREHVTLLSKNSTLEPKESAFDWQIWCCLAKNCLLVRKWHVEKRKWLLSVSLTTSRMSHFQCMEWKKTREGQSARVAGNENPLVGELVSAHRWARFRIGTLLNAIEAKLMCALNSKLILPFHRFLQTKLLLSTVRALEAQSQE